MLLGDLAMNLVTIVIPTKINLTLRGVYEVPKSWLIIAMLMKKLRVPRFNTLPNDADNAMLDKLFVVNLDAFKYGTLNVVL